MRVLITGGYGFLGAWIIKNLLAKFSQVWVYDLKEDPRRLTPIMPAADVAKVVFVEGDVTNQAALQEAIAKHQITHVIHLAGLQVPMCRANPMLGAKVNVVGTLAVFEAVRLAGEQIKRLVYASSAAVFGPPEKYPAGPLADDVTLFPTTHYGHFKCCNEGNAAVYFQDFGISSIGLRPWTVYGVGRDFGMTSEPTKAIKSLALGREYHITYGGIQDLQFVDDVAKIVRSAAWRARTRGRRAYNLRGHRGRSADVPPGAEQGRSDVLASWITFGDRQLAIAYDLDDAAILKDIGPLPKTPLEDGIRQTLAIFRQLAKEGRLDTSDLDAPAMAPTAVKGDEP